MILLLSVSTGEVVIDSPRDSNFIGFCFIYGNAITNKIGLASSFPNKFRSSASKLVVLNLD